MDIHAPERPIHGLKDFGIHIAVVTVGILIALSLEAVVESVREHRLVRETRENFRREMTDSQQNMTDEVKRVTLGRDRLNLLAQAAPTLGMEHADRVLAELKAVQNPNYFFSTNSWQAALSSGAVAHMDADEVTSYAWSAEGARIYSGLQKDSISAEVHAIAFWTAHPHPTAEQVESGTELVLLFAKSEETLAYVAPETQKGFDRALKSSLR